MQDIVNVYANSCYSQLRFSRTHYTKLRLKTSKGDLSGRNRRNVATFQGKKKLQRDQNSNLLKTTICYDLHGPCVENDQFNQLLGKSIAGYYTDIHNTLFTCSGITRALPESFCFTFNAAFSLVASYIHLVVWANRSIR